MGHGLLQLGLGFVAGHGGVEGVAVASAASGAQDDAAFDEEGHSAAHGGLADSEDRVDLGLLHSDVAAGVLVPDHH